MNIEEKVTPSEIIELVKRLPDSESHIYEWEGKQCITQEWLCGAFAGRGFEGNTLEEAAQQMIDYLYRQIGHNSMVGICVTESGFPNLSRVYEYCKPKTEDYDS